MPDRFITVLQISANMVKIKKIPVLKLLLKLSKFQFHLKAHVHNYDFLFVFLKLCQNSYIYGERKESPSVTMHKDKLVLVKEWLRVINLKFNHLFISSLLTTHIVHNAILIRNLVKKTTLSPHT